MTLFFFNHPPTPAIYTLSLHDALPISLTGPAGRREEPPRRFRPARGRRPRTLRACPTLGNRAAARVRHRDARSEEHTSELQSRGHLVCRLLLEKKKKRRTQRRTPRW